MYSDFYAKLVCLVDALSAMGEELYQRKKFYTDLFTLKYW